MKTTLSYGLGYPALQILCVTLLGYLAFGLPAHISRSGATSTADITYYLGLQTLISLGLIALLAGFAQRLARRLGQINSFWRWMPVIALICLLATYALWIFASGVIANLDGPPEASPWWKIADYANFAQLLALVCWGLSAIAIWIIGMRRIAAAREST